MEQINFRRISENLKDTGFAPNPDLVYVNIPNARQVLFDGIKYLTKDKAVWNEEYNKVVEWLCNNKGRGLLCIGNCGRGKTLICGRIIPMLLNYYHRKIVSCYDAQLMNEKPDNVKEKHIIYLDDIGTENISVKFGEKRLVFPEIVDEAEKKGKLLIITSNLSIEELKEKYGIRTIDRLRAITTVVLFKGESLRK